MADQTLHFNWGKTREHEGNVKIHVDRGGKLMVAVLDGDAVQDKYHVEPAGMVQAVLDDRGHIALAIQARAIMAPPNAVYESGTDIFRHYLLILRQDHF